jgi:antitoxin component HigA of HigAB toxin-antitoxin module
MVIKNELEYQLVFQKIEQLISENFEGNAQKEAQFSLLTRAIERYENEVLNLFPVRTTKDVATFLKSLMSHKKLKVNDLAIVLQISESELSAIIQHRKPLTFEHAILLKKEFDIDASHVLETSLTS